MSSRKSRSIRARRAEHRARRRRRRIYAALGIVGALIVVAVLVVVLQPGGMTADDVVLPETLEAPPNAEGKAWGAADAPVVIEEFADFQCPFCGQFANGTGRRLIETYGGSGVVRFEYNHFTFLGPESQQAAEAAECAREQGQFWQYHDTLYASQRGENQGAFSDDALKAFAAALGLDEEAFNQCLDSERYEADVQAETAAGRQRGVQSTPTLFINGEMVEGAVPFEQLQPFIEAAASSGTGAEE